MKNTSGRNQEIVGHWPVQVYLQNRGSAGQVGFVRGGWLVDQNIGSGSSCVARVCDASVILVSY